MAFCTKCGQQVTDNIKFCPNCGNKIVLATPQIQQPAPETASVPESTPVQTVTPIQTPAPEQPTVSDQAPAADIQTSSIYTQTSGNLQQSTPLQQSALDIQQGINTQQTPVNNMAQAQAQAQAHAQANMQQAIAQGAVIQQAAKQKSKLPIILGIAGGIAVVAIIAIVAVSLLGRVSKPVKGSGDALSQMLNTAGSNRQILEYGVPSSSDTSGSETNIQGESGDSKDSSDGGFSIKEQDLSTVTGDAFETDNMVVFVPIGWEAFPVVDMHSDAGANDPNKVRLIKGGSNADDYWSKNSILIEYHPNGVWSLYTDNYENKVDIKGLKIGEYSFDGAMGTIPGDWDVAMLYADYLDGYIEAQTFLRCGSSSISLDDADVQAILSSVVIKN